MSQTRRKFLTVVSFLSLGFAAKAAPEKKPQLVHHVFFWLKDPASAADRDKLIAGIKSLGNIRQVKKIHVGVPADTEKREVVDNSYSVSELLFFDSTEDQKAYQDHALHQKFIQEHSMLWSKWWCMIVWRCDGISSIERDRQVRRCEEAYAFELRDSSLMLRMTAKDRLRHAQHFKRRSRPAYRRQARGPRMCI